MEQPAMLRLTVRFLPWGKEEAEQVLWPVAQSASVAELSSALSEWYSSHRGLSQGSFSINSLRDEYGSLLPSSAPLGVLFPTATGDIPPLVSVWPKDEPAASSGFNSLSPSSNTSLKNRTVQFSSPTLSTRRISLPMSPSTVLSSSFMTSNSHSHISSRAAATISPLINRSQQQSSPQGTAQSTASTLAKTLHPPSTKAPNGTENPTTRTVDAVSDVEEPEGSSDSDDQFMPPRQHQRASSPPSPFASTTTLKKAAGYRSKPSASISRERLSPRIVSTGADDPPISPTPLKSPSFTTKKHNPTPLAGMGLTDDEDENDNLDGSVTQAKVPSKSKRPGLSAATGVKAVRFSNAAPDSVPPPEVAPSNGDEPQDGADEGQESNDDSEEALSEVEFAASAPPSRRGSPMSAHRSPRLLNLTRGWFGENGPPSITVKPAAPSPPAPVAPNEVATATATATANATANANANATTTTASSSSTTSIPASAPALEPVEPLASDHSSSHEHSQVSESSSDSSSSDDNATSVLTGGALASRRVPLDPYSRPASPPRTLAAKLLADLDSSAEEEDDLSDGFSAVTSNGQGGASAATSGGGSSAGGTIPRTSLSRSGSTRTGLETLALEQGEPRNPAEDVPPSLQSHPSLAADFGDVIPGLSGLTRLAPSRLVPPRFKSTPQDRRKRKRDGPSPNPDPSTSSSNSKRRRGK